jgi:sugar lactone lactonase YvrE
MRTAVVALLLFAAPTAAQDMPLTQVLIPGEGWRPVPGLPGGITDLSGDGRGAIYVVAVNGREVHRVGPDGKAALFARRGFDDVFVGLAAVPGGPLYALFDAKAAKGGREVSVITLDQDGETSREIKGLKEATALAVTPTGHVYCRLAGEGGLVRVGPDGKQTPVGPLPATARGRMTFWADHGTLVIADVEAPFLWALRVAADGTLNSPDRYYPLRFRPGKSSAAASLTLDAAGRLYAATPEGVQVFDPTGRLCGVLTAPAPDPELRGVAFGGKDLDLLFVATEKGVFVRKVKAKGVAPAEKKP